METVADIAVFALEPTDNAGQRWESWVRRFENYVVAKNIQTLDQYNARLQQLSKHCNFHDKDREVKSQIIQRCAMSKVRDKGLSEPTITLQRLLTFGRTLEATLQQSKIMGNCSASVPTPVHAVSKDGGGRHNSACGGIGVAQQMAPYRNSPRKHFPPDHQGAPRKYNHPVVSGQQQWLQQTSQWCSTGMFGVWWTATRRSADV